MADKSGEAWCPCGGTEEEHRPDPIGGGLVKYSCPRPPQVREPADRDFDGVCADDANLE